jgi:DNA-binding CsgD family transcriptional regulator
MTIHPESLTERQKQCLRLVAQGDKNLAIAYALGVSESTVKEHIQKATKTLGARNRRHAAALLMDLEKGGLWDRTPPFWPVDLTLPMPASDQPTEATLRDGNDVPTTLVPPPVFHRGEADETLQSLNVALTIVAMAVGFVVILTNYPGLVTLAKSIAASITQSTHH